VKILSARTRERNTSDPADVRVIRTVKKKNVTAPIGGFVADPTLAAMEQMELYRALYPASPAAVRRPRLTSRSDLWIALLGHSAEENIIGIGPTVEGALRAFDTEYLRVLRLPSEVLLTSSTESKQRQKNRHVDGCTRRRATGSAAPQKQGHAQKSGASSPAYQVNA
jgi:hypothetical protein